MGNIVVSLYQCKELSIIYFVLIKSATNRINIFGKKVILYKLMSVIKKFNHRIGLHTKY